MNSIDYHHTIFGKIQAKRWNIYESTRSVELGADIVIREKMVDAPDQLKERERYVLLPFAQNPRDPVQVMAELDKLAQRLNRETPTITIQGVQHPLTGFIFYQDEVKVVTPEGTFISHTTFIDALDSLVLC